MGLYSHYDGAHNHPVNRALHLIAIPVGFSSLIVVWFHWIIGLLLIPTAFALAWLGHLIEGNKPAFLTNPVHVSSRRFGWRRGSLAGAKPRFTTLAPRRFDTGLYQGTASAVPQRRYRLRGFSR